MQGGSSNQYYHDRQRSNSRARSLHAPSTHNHHSKRDDRSPKENSYDNRRSYPLARHHHHHSRDYRRDATNWDPSRRMSHSTSSPRHHQRRSKAPSEQVVVHTAPFSSNQILQLAKQSLSKNISSRSDRPTEPRDSSSSSTSDGKGVKRHQTDEITSSSPPKISKPTEDALPRPKLEKRKSRLSLMKNTARAEKEVRQQDDVTKNDCPSHTEEEEAIVKVDKVEEARKKVDDKEKKKKGKPKTSEKKRHSKSAQETGSSEELEVIANVSARAIPTVIVKDHRNCRDSSPEVLWNFYPTLHDFQIYLMD
jgi:hypothetical protein